MPTPEEDGYSLEGFNVPGVIVEVSASQITSLEKWQKCTIEEDSPEDTIEIQAARNEYAAGDYITFDEYHLQRANKK